MALHPDFPHSPHAILDPEIRWFPADEILRDTTMDRLKQWCEDINRVQKDTTFDFIYVDEEGFDRYKPSSFKQLLDSFREYNGSN